MYAIINKNNAPKGKLGTVLSIHYCRRIAVRFSIRLIRMYGDNLTVLEVGGRVKEGEVI